MVWTPSTAAVIEQPSQKLGCFMIMVGGLKARMQFPAAIQSLHRFYLRRFPYDVLVFHTGSADRLRRHVPEGVNAIFVDVSPAWPSHPLVPKGFGEVKMDACAQERTLPYLHGNNFWTVYLFKEVPLLRQYRYIWKIDVDANLLAPAPKDYFREMARKQLVFSYYVKHSYSEIPHCHQGVMEFFAQFLKRHPEFAWQHRDRIQERTIYWGFSWILSTDVAFSRGFQLMVDQVYESGGIYEHRWDVQNLMPGMMAILVPHHKLHWQKDIRIRHQGDPLPRDE